MTYMTASLLSLGCVRTRHLCHSWLSSPIMNDVHIAAFDLNLLLTFETLWSERNVTRAARRVGLSQSALSHALRRLRLQLDDPLFLNSPRGLMPTPRAQSLAAPLREALAMIRGAVESPAAFDPGR